MDAKEIKRLASTVSSPESARDNFGHAHAALRYIHQQIAERMMIPSVMLIGMDKGSGDFTATEIASHRFFHCAEGICIPHRRRRVDCRIVEPKQLVGEV